jgi:hypothetical protein
MRVPPGLYEGLELAPPWLPLVRQAAFLRSYSQTHPTEDYMDAVRALYRTMRSQTTLR